MATQFENGLTMNQLAERNAVLVSEVEKLRAERDQLAAENVGLKGVVSEINNELYGQGFQVAGWHLNGALEPLDNWFTDNGWGEPETPATDRIYAGIKADALPANIAEIIDSGDLETICYESERSYAEDFRLALYNFRQLREGAK